MNRNNIKLYEVLNKILSILQKYLDSKAALIYWISTSLKYFEKLLIILFLYLRWIFFNLFILLTFTSAIFILDFILFFEQYIYKIYKNQLKSFALLRLNTNILYVCWWESKDTIERIIYTIYRKLFLIAGYSNTINKQIMNVEISNNS